MLRIGEELAEGEQRVALLVELAEHALLDAVELDVVPGPQPAARPIREDPVVELVGGSVAAPLERLREAVGAMREHPVHATRELRLSSVHRGRLYVTAP